MDLKRSINEEVYEKEAVRQTANDLRNMVKKLEAEKVENGRLIQEMKQRIACAYINTCFQINCEQET